ncbi:porin [Mesorhizobium tamadayense]|uniref:Porin n=1 Tax=Mesorhizobium tamadayense TaxID=425306 RepID=A0A3P3FSJ7_9HYPH|nr:porin [Mesorhizobium tamadayense]RRI01518.1 porin [Mesorhizobium tamadayense]
MSIKSLLLGFASAIIAVSGARAADAVVELEPAEYVKICDVYGAGYFYIPGTESCLRIGGYVRYDIGVGHVGSNDGARTSAVRTGDHRGTWRNNTRFAFKIWTGQETELGALKTHSETRFDFGNRNSGPDIPQNYASKREIMLTFAWIQLGGLRVGKDWSAFDTFIGYAGNVLNDMTAPYGGLDTNAVQYYFDAGNGLSAVVSLEKGSGVVGSIDSYVPHVVGGVKYTQGRGAITSVVAYDSNYGSVASKVRVDVNVTSEFSLFAMLGYGSNGRLNDGSSNVIDAHGRGFYKQWGGNWAFWAGGTYKVTEKNSLNLRFSGDQIKNHSVAANVAYTVVAGFTATVEVYYYHYGNCGVGMVDTSNVNWTDAEKKNSVGGTIRFQRSF